jgi:2-polyprenyl-3-methyl-5-hydroxy-6-metoxy-1,4-benzoquinol methylase
MDNYNLAYTNWKKWGVFFEADSATATYFAGEFLDIPLNGQRVFEMGFGAGQFMAWARKQGASVAGSELNADLVAAGVQKKFDVRLGELHQVVDPSNETFDVIVAFDVLEHVAEEQLLPILHFLASILKTGGVFVARFPNGQSPFGMAWQHGDITHRNILSASKMQQLADMACLDVQRCGNAFRPISPGFQGLKDRIQSALRNMIQFALSKVYALGDLPMDPNVVVVLRKR